MGYRPWVAKESDTTQQLDNNYSFTGPNHITLFLLSHCYHESSKETHCLDNRYSSGGGLNLRDTLSSQAACWYLICVRTICQAGRVIGCKLSFSTPAWCRRDAFSQGSGYCPENKCVDFWVTSFQFGTDRYLFFYNELPGVSQTVCLSHLPRFHSSKKSANTSVSIFFSVRLSCAIITYGVSADILINQRRKNWRYNCSVVHRLFYGICGSNC